MRVWQFLLTGISMLAIGLIFWGRGIWISLLAVLAGAGMVQVRSDDNYDNEQGKAINEAVTCYHMATVPANILQDGRWEGSQEVGEWAKAERAILAYATTGEANYDGMQKKIAVAQQAAANAKQVVASGLLSKAGYDLAVRTMAEWHADMAIHYTGVKCYRRAVPPPAVEDASNRLYSLAQLQIEGNLTAEAVNEARSGMIGKMQETIDPTVSEEVSAFLLDLMGM